MRIDSLGSGAWFFWFFVFFSFSLSESHVFFLILFFRFFSLLKHTAASTTATNTNTAIPTAAEIEKKIKEAADAARAEGEAELDDLLACLGEEERKVEVLTAKLAEFGVDAAALHAASAPDDAKKASSGDDLT